MEQEFIFDGKNSITWRHTPWDQKVFEKKTVELLSIESENPDSCNEMLKEFEANLEPELLYGRFSASDQFIKKCLLDAGFFQCETAMNVVMPKLNEYRLPEIFSKRTLSVQDPDKKINDQIVKNASRMFSYSRFHEDPYLGAGLADKRMASWTEDLIRKKVPALVYKNATEKLVAFLFYKTEGDAVDFLLGGSVNGRGVYAPYFFGSVVQHFKNQGKRKIRTTISAANTGVLSLYFTLGFNVSATKTDYHKHCSNR